MISPRFSSKRRILRSSGTSACFVVSPSTDHVVRVGHELHPGAFKVGVKLAGVDVECLAWLKMDQIQQERGNNTHVIGKTLMKPDHPFEHEDQRKPCAQRPSSIWKWLFFDLPRSAPRGWREIRQDAVASYPPEADGSGRQVKEWELYQRGRGSHRPCESLSVHQRRSERRGFRVCGLRPCNCAPDRPGRSGDGFLRQNHRRA